MAATIQSLFPLSKVDSKDFIVFPCFLEFSAPVIAGKYVFSESTTPAQKFGKLLQKQTGIIAGVMIAANCPELEFTSAMEKPLLLQIVHGGNKSPVNLSPFPFANFSQAENFQLEWESTGSSIKQEEDFYLAINGEVEQLPNMTNTDLSLKVIFNFIRVGTDKLKKIRMV